MRINKHVHTHTHTYLTNNALLSLVCAPQLTSQQIDTSLRDDMERLKKIRNHRGLRAYWGFKVRPCLRVLQAVMIRDPVASKFRGTILFVLCNMLVSRPVHFTAICPC
jgi:hypothetical protein